MSTIIGIPETPFIVINADDYYGKEGFKAVHEYLVNGGKSCMAGFVLKNTLSDNGGVTRGICKMDAENNLTEVVETKNIIKTADGAETDGKVIDVNSLVSMNMWGLTPDFLDVLEEGFKEFFEKEVPGNPLKAEYLIPIFIGELLEQGKMSVKVLKTNDTWYGMTYHEDVAAVKDSFKKMLADGMMVPFSAVVMWTFGEKIGNGWKKILWQSGKIAFIFSISIEMLQLLLRLGTFQLSDIFYNTVGGVLGGLMYCAVMKARKRL